ncbi:MAG: cell division protein FtsL [Gammaproteobacteria bacterium]|nr:cell division protein FtsL [Gammaproteobacteria bacterium]
MTLKITTLMLGVLLVVTALGVVYAKHQNRMMYVEFRDLQQHRDALDVDWGRLQLEQSTWATHSRIEEVAHQKLAMRNVDYNDVVIVKP